jgi:Holliday junction DNA helicase RuvA
MIATLTGALAVRDAGRIVVETGGVGYEVLIPLSTYYRLPQLGDRVALEIRQVVREDALTLYGFSSATEKRAFDLLMSVQHVGPKLALAILSVLAPEELVTAIGKGDVDRIDAVPGVGPKVAERVVRELRDKVADLKMVAPSSTAPDGYIRPAPDGNGRPAGPADEAVSALVNLGMKPVEARRTVDAVVAADAGAAENPEVIIRKSLAVLLGEK